jgi:hypothetical protein
MQNRPVRYVATPQPGFPEDQYRFDSTMVSCLRTHSSVLKYSSFTIQQEFSFGLVTKKVKTWRRNNNFKISMRIHKHQRTCKYIFQSVIRSGVLNSAGRMRSSQGSNITPSIFAVYEYTGRLHAHYEFLTTTQDQ